MTSSNKDRRNFIRTAMAAGLGIGAIASARAQGTASGSFAGKVVLITGATSGIGRTTAELFAGNGASVAFCGRREALGREVEAGIRKAGGEAFYMRADVRDEAQVKAFVDATVARYGRLDIAFNNAGIDRPPAPIAETDAAASTT